MQLLFVFNEMVMSFTVWMELCKAKAVCRTVSDFKVEDELQY